jgi:hypothetical protein
VSGQSSRDRPSDGDDRDRVMRIIMARCPELTDADLALITSTQPAAPPAASSDNDTLPVEIADQILDVVIVVDQLQGWVELERRPTGEPQH